MLYFICGDNTEKTRGKARELLFSLRKTRPDASAVSLDEESFALANMEELAGSQGLFEKKLIVFADNVFRNELSEGLFWREIKTIAESENIFIFLEGTVGKLALEKIKKLADKVLEMNLPAEKSGRPSGKNGNFNIFAMADALCRKDKKTLWAIFREAVLRGISPEEINGVLFWQLKSAVIASRAKSFAEAGMKPFVFQKSKNCARNFGESGLLRHSSELVSIYHDAHLGLCDFETSLERFILSI